MKDTFYEVHFDLEKTIDYAFEGKFMINFYEYLKVKDAKLHQVEQFMESSTVQNINDIIKNLEEYIEGGQDSNHKQLREAYGHIPKPQARKIKNYFENILEDAVRYTSEKSKKRRKRRSK